jgi:glutamate-1-semialdehyde aminotransferase
VNFDQRWAERIRRSAELSADASKIVPGGAGSSARTAKFGWKPYPPFIAGGYLELLRSETRARGALLIFDEVITGFRFCRGGAQEWFGVTPDLTTLATDAGLPVTVDGIGTVFQMFLRGALFHPSQYENLFVSLVTTDEDIDATPAAANDSFKVLAAEAS